MITLFGKGTIFYSGLLAGTCFILSYFLAFNPWIVIIAVGLHITLNILGLFKIYI